MLEVPYLEVQRRPTVAKEIRNREEKQTAKRNMFLRSLHTSPYKSRKDRNVDRVTGTCGWFTDHPLFRAWQANADSSLLWVFADSGCGKTVLAKHLVDHVLANNTQTTTAYFFLNDDFIEHCDIVRHPSIFR